MGKIIVGAFLCVCLTLFTPCVFAGETGWICEATSLLSRFENIGAAAMTPVEKQDAYRELLTEVSRLAQDGDLSSREARANATFAVWMCRRIYEQLGDVPRMEQMRQKYQKTLASLPEEESAVFRLLFERVEKPQQVSVQRMCEVETKGDKIRVTAVDYPVRGLLQKIAAALGGEINISSNVSGRTDLGQDRLSEGWVRADFLVSRFARTRGLSVKGDVTKSMEIFPEDPLYMASLAERVRKQAEEADQAPVEGGIKTGYLIVNGVYVPPPYKVELRTVGDKCAVYVNGAQVGSGHSLGLPKPGVPIPVDRSKPFTVSDRDKSALVLAAHEMYIKLSKTRGHAEAIASLGRFLDGEKVVKSWKLDENANELWITFTDGEPMSAMLPWPKSGPAPSAGDRRDAYRKKGLAEAEKAKTDIERTLQTNGLVIALSDGAVCRFKGESAQLKLRAICHALEETLRLQEQLCDCVFDAIYPDPQQWAWEVFLNIRHRELIERMTSDGLM